MNIIFVLTHVNVPNCCIAILSAVLKVCYSTGKLEVSPVSRAKVLNKLYSDDGQAVVVSDPCSVTGVTNRHLGRLNV